MTCGSLQELSTTVSVGNYFGQFQRRTRPTALTEPISGITITPVGVTS